MNGPWDFLKKIVHDDVPEPQTPPSDLKEQVFALLTNSAYKYAASRLGTSELHGNFYGKIFTARRATIDRFLRDNNILIEDFGAQYHRLKLFKSGDKWIVSQFMPPEKTPGYEHEIECASYEMARSLLLDKLLANAGTGLKFT